MYSEFTEFKSIIFFLICFRELINHQVFFRKTVLSLHLDLLLEISASVEIDS